MSEPGTWARRVRPPWAWTVYDVAERLAVSPRWARALIRRHHIPTGLLTLRVRLRPGCIRTRRLTVLTPTAVEELFLRHAGYRDRASREALPRSLR